ncbi:MAG TPA: SRPBCC domain-containing protein [Chitinophagaceae bacterium]|nr:SRPBCC domain-containing protein [Chitinophagaceae bacterium]
MKKGDSSRFVKRISIRSSPEKVYNSWATSAGLESWFLRKAEFQTIDGRLRDNQQFAQQGDKYHWLWHGYDDTVSENRFVLSANGIDLFQFEFTAGCIVTVSINKEAGETICELTQEKLPDNQDITDHLYVLCGEGWTFYMTNLKSLLEGGIDLRNKNVELKNMVNA